jgi:hypothetical protein
MPLPKPLARILLRKNITTARRCFCGAQTIQNGAILFDCGMANAHDGRGSGAADAAEFAKTIDIKRLLHTRSRAVADAGAKKCRLGWPCARGRRAPMPEQIRDLDSAKPWKKHQIIQSLKCSSAGNGSHPMPASR